MSRFLPSVFCIFIGIIFLGCPLFGAGGSVNMVINNHASAAVYEVWPGSYSHPYIQSILVGESVSVLCDWPEGGSEIYLSISFLLRGLKYGTSVEEYPQRYKPSKRVKDGETVTVNIYDDRWEW